MIKSFFTFVAGVCVLSLVGCVSTNQEPDKATENTGSVETMTSGDHTQVMVFEGGFGKDFYEQAALEYSKEKGTEVEVIGDPRIDEMIKPKFLEGNPPDLAFPGWRFDHWGAVNDSLIMPLDSALNEQNWEGDAVWKDTFDPAVLKLGQKEGKQYVLPYFYSILGWWYDPVLFKENGWEAPKTYAELLTLCQKIKAKGIAPITYQGKYPDYMIAGMLIPWTISSGGQEQFKKMQNLEKGAWSSSHVVKAASMIAELRMMEYFQGGATAMNHTEAQTEFVTGKAAMIPCGTWLHAEMLDSMPEGTQMEFMLPPVIAEGKGDPSAIMIKIEPWMVPSDAKNQATAIDFYKYMTSRKKSAEFVKSKGTFVAVKGSDEGNLPVYLQTAAKNLALSKDVWAQQWKEWYPSFYGEVEKALTRLLNGELSPEEFASFCEAEAEKVRNNSALPKYKVD